MQPVSHEINLIGAEWTTALRRKYFLRLALLFLLLVSAVFAVGAALLSPSYLLAERAAEAGERYFAALEETVGVRERAGVSEDIRALQERVRILSEEANEPSFAPLFEALLADRSPAISISGIAFAKGGDALQVSVTGSAETRAALIAFSNRLKEHGSFEGVSIPVSQFAEDSNIPFSITATFKSRSSL